MALSISGGNGNPAAQASTQSPQSATGSNTPGAVSTSSVQPDAATNKLSQSGGGEGVSLSGTALTVVNINTGTQTSTQPPTPTPQPKHHLNPLLLAVVIGLVVLALVFFWITARSAKNTTHY